jgi:DNA-binding GntR family transcriptional regulator
MDQSTRTAPRISSRKFARMQWDPNLRERKTITDYLAAALRTAIYDGQFEDREALNQVELAEFFGVSRVPIREALRQLQAEGLVQNIAHHKTVVVGLTLEQIVEAIEMRAVLEAHLLRKTAPLLGKTELADLRRICRETDRIRDYGSDWVLKNWEFHRALYGRDGRADSPATVAMVERLQLNVERYARRAGNPQRLREAAREHWEIVRALERKDAATASALLERHIINTAHDVQRNREAQRGSERSRMRKGSANAPRGSAVQRGKNRSERTERRLGASPRLR